MNTLEAHKKRLQAEIANDEAAVKKIRGSQYPDLKLLHELNERLERNRQLVGMIRNHVDCNKHPMWREKKAEVASSIKGSHL